MRGTEKQIKWANDIKEEITAKFQRVVEFYEGRWPGRDATVNMRAVFEAAIENDNAADWIDARDGSINQLIRDRWDDLAAKFGKDRSYVHYTLNKEFFNRFGR